MDVEDMPGGIQFREKLQRAISAANVLLIFVISPNSAASRECRREADYAASLNKRALPVLLEAVDPQKLAPILASHNWIPQLGAFNDDYEGSFAALVEAIDADPEHLRAHTQLGNKAGEWDRSRGSPSFLLRGSELEDAEGWLATAPGRSPEPTVLHTTFIADSRAAATMRLRRTRAIVGVGLVVALALAVVALIQRGVAIDNEHEARSRELAATSASTLVEDPELSTLLALEALDVKATDEAENALRRAVADLRIERTVDVGPAPLIAAFSPDGGRFGVDYQGLVPAKARTVLWDASTGDSIAEIPGSTAVSEITYAGSGIRFAVAAADGTIEIVGADGSPEATLELQDGSRPTALAFATGVRALAGRRPVGLDRDLGRSTMGSGGAPESPGRDLRPVVRGGRPRPDLGRERDRADRGRGREGRPKHRLSGERRCHAQPGRSPVRVRRRPARHDRDRSRRRERRALDRAQRLDLRPRLRRRIDTPGDRRRRRHSDRLGREGTRLSSLRGHDANIYTADFSGDGGGVLTTSFDGTARIWSLNDAPRTELPHPFGTVSVAFSPQGERLAVGMVDGSIRIWDATAEAPEGTFDAGDGGGAAVVFDHAGKWIATPSPGGVTLWDAATRSRAVELSGARGTPESIAFAPDGRVAAAGTAGVYLWDVEDPESPTVVSSEPASSLAFAGDDLLLGVHRRGIYAARLWDLQRGTHADLTSTDDLGVFATAVSPDATRFATGHAAGPVRIAELPSGGNVCDLDDTGVLPTSMVFSPAGRHLMTASDSRPVAVFDLATGDPALQLPQPDVGLTQAAFGPSGEIAVVGVDEQARVYDCDFCGSLNQVVATARDRVTRELTPEERERSVGE